MCCYPLRVIGVVVNAPVVLEPPGGIHQKAFCHAGGAQQVSGLTAFIHDDRKNERLGLLPLADFRQGLIGIRVETDEDHLARSISLGQRVEAGAVGFNARAARSNRHQNDDAAAVVAQADGLPVEAFEGDIRDRCANGDQAVVTGDDVAKVIEIIAQRASGEHVVAQSGRSQHQSGHGQPSGCAGSGQRLEPFPPPAVGKQRPRHFSGQRAKAKAQHRHGCLPDFPGRQGKQQGCQQQRRNPDDHGKRMSQPGCNPGAASQPPAPTQPPQRQQQ
jgi:hypothetical protein